MSDDFYRKAISEAEAKRAARDETIRQRNQQAQDTATKQLAESNKWYNNVFLSEIESANRAVDDVHARFEVLKAQQMGSAIVCEFRFTKPQNSPQLYKLTVGAPRYNINEYIVDPSPNRRVNALKERHQSPISKFTDLSTEENADQLRLILSEILKERFG